jgi:uncharacterized protein (DUF1697 family)
MLGLRDQMPRYVAFLRGVSPLNAKMPELRACFEAFGFTDVKTVLSSGNVIFTAPKMAEPALVKEIESAMAASLPRSFPVIVRATDHLQTILKQDVYSGFRISPQEKRVVSFLAKVHPTKVSLPIELNGARILAIRDRDIFTAYTPNDEARYL